MTKAARKLNFIDQSAAPQTSAAVPPDHIPSRLILLSQIRPFSGNPRKDFNAEELARLTSSIIAKGVLEPIIVRPLKAAGQVVPESFEIVAGERRWRSAGKAGLTHIPAIVRDVADGEMLELAITENDVRDNLRALERTNAHQQMRKEGKSLADIAKATTCSEATVRDSLKLGDLVPELKKAWGEGKLDYSRALELAKLPAKLQPAALKDALEPVRNYDSGADPEPRTVRQLRALLLRDYMLDLKKAPFAVADAQLVPAAGACTTCPKRTGSQPELFEHVKSADVCTDKLCYQGKCAAVLARAEKEGRKVLGPKVAKQAFNEYGSNLNHSSGFVRADDKPWDAKKPYGKQVEPEAIVLAQNPWTGEVVELVPQSALPKDREAKRTPRVKDAGEVRREREHALRSAAQVAIIDEMSRAKDVEVGTDLFLRAVARGMVQSVQQEPVKQLCGRLGLEPKPGDDFRERLWEEQLDTLGGAALRRVVLHLAYADRVAASMWSSGLDDVLVAGAKMLRVDVKKVEASAKKVVGDEFAAKKASKDLAAKIAKVRKSKLTPHQAEGADREDEGRRRKAPPLEAEDEGWR